MIDPGMFRPLAGKVGQGRTWTVRTVHGGNGDVFMPGSSNMPVDGSAVATPLRPGSTAALLTDGAASLVLGQVNDGRLARPMFTVRIFDHSVVSGSVVEVPFGAAPSTDLSPATGLGAKHINVLDPWGMWGDRHVLNGQPGGYSPFGWVATAGATVAAGGACTFTGGQVWAQLRGLVAERTYSVSVDVTPTGNPVRMRVVPLSTLPLLDRATALTSVPLADPLSVGGQSAAEQTAPTGGLTRLTQAFIAPGETCVVVFDAPGGSATATVANVACAEGDGPVTFAAGNYNRLTVPISGMWEASAEAWWQSNDVGDRFIGVERVDTSARLTQAQVPAASSGTFISATSGPVWLDAGTVIRAVARQTSGNSIELDMARLSLAWMG